MEFNQITEILTTTLKPEATSLEYSRLTVVFRFCYVAYNSPEVQRIYQLYFVIHYCCDNTRKVRAPNAVRRSGAPHM
jgi:hypothetical protein